MSWSRYKILIIERGVPKDIAELRIKNLMQLYDASSSEELIPFKAE